MYTGTDYNVHHYSSNTVISDGSSKSLCRDDTCFLGFWGFPPPETHAKHAQNKKLIA